jgi:hypothetical protein
MEVPQKKKKLKIELSYDPAIPPQAHTQSNVSQQAVEAPAHPYL